MKNSPQACDSFRWAGRLSTGARRSRRLKAERHGKLLDGRLPVEPRHWTASGNLTAVSGKGFWAHAVKVLLEERLINCMAVREHHDPMDKFCLARPGACTVFNIVYEQRLGFGKHPARECDAGPPGVH